jgi:hypothetical protein
MGVFLVNFTEPLPFSLQRLVAHHHAVGDLRQHLAQLNDVISASSIRHDRRDLDPSKLR